MVTSSTSSIVSTLGGGSGIDMAALASNLAEAQFKARTDRLTTRSETLERQISLASSLRNSLTTLASSLGTRVRDGDLAPQAQLANPSVAKATAEPGARGNVSYSLEVLSLASAQTLKSGAFASPTTVVGSGTLTLRFGTVTGGSFTQDSDQASVDITIPSGTTLSGIASAINAANAGVTAYVANGSDGARLVLKGKEGAENGFILEAQETLGEEGLAALAWEPATGDAARLVSASSDARFRLDGVDMTSPSNRTGIVAPGLSLTLTGTNTGAPTTVSFTSPVASISSAMQDLTDALNTIAADLAAAIDPLNGDLARDPGARALQRALAELAGTVVMPNAPPGAPRTLADLGLATERKGGFRLDATRLAATLARDPAGAAAMFTSGLDGIYATIDKISRTATSSTNPASLAWSIDRYTTMKTTLGKQASELAEKQANLRAQLTSRFAIVDSRVGASKSTLSFLQAQIDAWNGADK